MDRSNQFSASRRATLPALTSIRFLAALWVVLLHIAANREAIGEQLFANDRLHNLVMTGYCGVGLFFLLSGFILAYNYLDMDLGRESVAKFGVARFARIVPIYCVGLALTLPFTASSLLAEGLTATSVASALVSLLLCLLLIQAWFPSAALSWNGPGWSLSVEAFFYTLFPICLSRIRSSSTARLVAALLLLQVAALLPPLLASTLGIDGFSHTSAASLVPPSPWPNFFKFFPLFRLPEFVFGIVVGVLYCRHANSALLRKSAFAMILVGIASVLAVCMVASDRIPYPLMHNGLLLVPFAAILLGLAQNHSLLSRLLSHKSLEILGCASYSLYIIHLPLIQYYVAISKRLKFDLLGNPTTLLACLAMTIGCSILLWRFVEEPARGHIMRAWQRRERPAALFPTTPSPSTAATMTTSSSAMGRIPLPSPAARTIE
jgi:peptidoglycan/LPS O-acetylase OafA/YrhL